MITVPSQKLFTKARGVMTCGLSGNGFIAFNPWLMLVSDYNNTVGFSPVAFTLGAYNQSGINFSPPYGVQVSGVGSNSIYTASDFESGGINQYRSFRLVAAGIKATYCGNSFYNQGRVILCRWPNNTVNNGVPADGSVNGGTLLQIPSTSWVAAASRTSHAVTYLPLTPDDFTYDSTVARFAPAYPQNNYYMYIYVDGSDGENQQIFNFEAVAYFEIIGGTIPTTSSHSDPPGVGAVISSVSREVPTKPPAIVKAELISNTIRNISETASTVIGMIPGTVGSVARLADAGIHLLSGTRHTSGYFGASQRISGGGYPTITDAE
jgi:hypothetical protein